MTGLEGYLDVEEREDQQHCPTFYRLFKIILRHRGFFLGGTALILVGTAATLLEPRVMGYAIDEALIPKNSLKLRDFTLLFLLIECIRVSAMIGHSYLFEALGQRVMQDLRIALFSQFQALPISVYDKNPVGRLVTRVTNDVSAMAEMFSAGFVTMGGNILVVLGILAWLFFLNWKLAVIAISIFPLLFILSVYFSAQLRVAYRNARSKLSALNAFLAENILGIRVVHLFNREALHFKRFSQVNQWYTDAQVASIRVFAFFQPTITIAAGISMALVIFYGGRMSASGGIPLGVLVAVFSYVLTLFQPLREIADKWNIFLSGLTSAERIFAVLDWKSEYLHKQLSASAKPLMGIRGHLIFDHVWFAYQKDWVLKDFSLEVPAGAQIGIVGHTGAGKTTLIHLLMRFYEPTQGRILLDGRDLRDYDKRSLRATLGLIQQDVFLFSGSIRENVTLWRDISPQAEMLVQQMNLTSEKRNLQERGGNLSMGQRQVLAFARALAADPTIWILDEATANMDTESERLLSGLLRKAARNKTTLLIAHRLSTVRNADQILVLHKGALIEQGTHSALLKKNGLYSRLYRYQAALQDNPC